MENVSKALLIAAGMFLAILLISLLVTLYEQISDFYEQKHEFAKMEQAYEFNTKFESYNRKNIRGSDLISLMNMIIDYNATESYFEDKSYKRIIVNIRIGEENLDAFKPNFGDSKFGTKNKFIKANITNATGGGNDYDNDRQLVAITGTSSDLVAMAADNGFNITDTKLQQLESNMHNIIIDENEETVSAIDNRYYRANILEKLIGWNKSDMNVDEDTWISRGNTATKMDVIKEITSQYHQYIQFKRAYFDCTEVIYDPDVNRIVEMNFQIQLDDDNNVVFN